MSIEKLEEIKENFLRNTGADYMLSGEDAGNIIVFFENTLNIFKTQSTQIADLKAKVKKLEQQQTYYPFSEEELMREPVGGTD